MRVKGTPIRSGDGFLFSINFSYHHKKIKTYINDEDFAGIGGVYVASTKSHKYLLIEFIQEYATSYWLFQENVKIPSVILVAKSMYLREDDNIEIERSSDQQKEYWISEQGQNVLLFFKRGNKGQCKKSRNKYI